MANINEGPWPSTKPCWPRLPSISYSYTGKPCMRMWANLQKLNPGPDPAPSNILANLKNIFADLCQNTMSRVHSPSGGLAPCWSRGNRGGNSGSVQLLTISCDASWWHAYWGIKLRAVNNVYYDNILSWSTRAWKESRGQKGSLDIGSRMQGPVGWGEMLWNNMDSTQKKLQCCKKKKMRPGRNPSGRGSGPQYNTNSWSNFSSSAVARVRWMQAAQIGESLWWKMDNSLSASPRHCFLPIITLLYRIAYGDLPVCSLCFHGTLFLHWFDGQNLTRLWDEGADDERQAWEPDCARKYLVITVAWNCCVSSVINNSVHDMVLLQNHNIVIVMMLTMEPLQINCCAGSKVGCKNKNHDAAVC